MFFVILCSHQCEYIQARDYCNGMIIVIDNTEAYVLECVKWFNAIDLKDAITILREGYGMRIKGIHFISESKAIELVIAIFKQVLSSKLSDRLKVHIKIDTLYEYVPKHILPVEYGGEEKSMIEFREKFKEALTSNEFSEYLREINKACTNERLRLNNVDDAYLGVQGTFRNLNVD